MTLSFHEIGLRWPDAVVLWDRDVAPTLDWEPRFVELRSGFVGALSAQHPDCVRTMGLASAWHNESTCRCLVWDEADSEWVSRAEMKRRFFERESAKLAANRIDPNRWSRHAWSIDSDSNHFTENSYSDLADAIARGAERMWWRHGDSDRLQHGRALQRFMANVRERYPQPRWPTLRRVLGRNAPR